MPHSDALLDEVVPGRLYEAARAAMASLADDHLQPLDTDWAISRDGGYITLTYIPQGGLDLVSMRQLADDLGLPRLTFYPWPMYDEQVSSEMICFRLDRHGNISLQSAA